jgi:tRNA-splicing ligase RtcB
MGKRRKPSKEPRRAAAKAVKVPLAPPPYRGHVPLEPMAGGTRWRIPPRGPMRVPGVVFADEALLPGIEGDRSLEQVANVATLPGIVGASMAMPDIHWGYGFPIGGVAAFDPTDGGVVSPGGVGYDINCGVRLLASDASVGALKRSLPQVVDALFEAIPAGVGSSRDALSATQLDELLEGGLDWALHRGWADKDDVARVEERGRLPGAQARAVSDRAKKRGGAQVGTLGSGNHFAELGVVEEVFDEAAADAFGLAEGVVTLMIHSGSRGLGHQVCTDALGGMLRASAAYGIPLVDRQLCCAPIGSPEAERYLAAMAAAANFAFVNRQRMTHAARRVFDAELGGTLRTVYDVCHNIAKWERHEVDSRDTRLLVHRKGATRALPPEHPQLPAAYRSTGQPVIIPGDMGRYSFVLAGASGSSESFGSACHGAGRVLSRSEARRRFTKSAVERELEGYGVLVRGASTATVVEEMPEVYKDVAEVVEVVDRSRLATKVARLRPLGVIKG